MKKRVLTFVLTVIMVLFTACGGGSSTIADSVVSDFKTVAAGGGSAYEIAEKLLENEALEFMGAGMEVEEGYLNGFSEEISGFTEGAMFGPVIGTIPFIGYVFKTDGDAAAKELLSSLSKCADPRWNICTEADDTASAAVGSYVVFVMSPRSF